MSFNYRNRENFQSEELKKILKGSVFWPAKFKSDVHFRRPWPEKLVNSKQFPLIIENIGYGGRASLRLAAMRLAQRLQRFTSSHAACNRRYLAAQIFSLVRKKLIHSTLFAAGGNKTLEFISN